MRLTRNSLIVSLFYWVLLASLLIPQALRAQGTTPLTPGEYVIGGIRVEGNEYTDANSVLLLSGLSVGDAITIPGDDFANTLRNLWKQNIFADVQLLTEKVVGNKLFLVIQVTERPRISKYSFSGVSKSQADDLREQIKFIRGQRFTEAKRRMAIRLIKNYFAEKGFLNTEVEVTTRPDPSVPNGIIVVLKVEKNKRVKIQEIRITGIEGIPERKLQAQMKDTKEKRWWRFWKRSKYIPALYQEDKKKILNYLRSQGYRDAELRMDTLIHVDERNVVLQMEYYRGKQYYFRDIEWIGNYTYTDGKLDTLLGIESGDVYDTQLLERRLMMDPAGADVSSLYLDNGYLFFRADPVEVAVDGDSVDLEIRMAEGPRAKYRKIIIEGNDKTSDHVILRNIRTLPGNYFSRSEIIRSQREIMNLGYFNQETMNVIPIPNPQDGTVDIKYVVEEKPSDQLFFQGGWGGQIRDSQGNVISNGLVATVGLTFNNFSTRKLFEGRAWNPLPAGDGQQLSLRIQLNGRGFQNYSISFVEPWLGGKKPNSLGVSAYYSLQRSFITDYRIAIFGGSVDYGRRLNWPDDFFRTTTSLNYRYYDVTGANNLFGEFNEGYINIISIRQAIERNSINAPIYPTEGSKVMLSVEATPPYSWFNGQDYSSLSLEDRFKFLEFHKWKFEAQSFMRLFGNTVLMPRVQFGYLGLYTEEVGKSPFERFYLGGDGLFGFALDGREIIALRGYKYPYLGDGGAGNVVYNKYTMELRQPISLQPSATVWLHGYLEAGNAWPEFEDFNPLNIYRSAGVGIRIFLPIFGLLGVDYGYGFDPVISNGTDLGINGHNWHFMIGQQF